MDNYKIKVKDEASADEARDLFKKLGYHPDNSSYEPYVEWVAVFEDGSGSFYSHNMNLNECVEITIAQLRDLVVLKRNDVKDATHEDQYGDKWLYLDERHYVYLNDQWDLPIGEFLERYELKPILPVKKQDPALISGADALRALADGKEIQYSTDGRWVNCSFSGFSIHDFLGDTQFTFRLKPQTIKVELEIPAPFQPKEGEQCCYITDESINGYHTVSYNSERYSGMHFGLYRPSDIEKVVALFRSAFGGAS
ncbi:TPA: hypothetical protein ACNH0Y_002859 [Acinetobacter baumannii]